MSSPRVSIIIPCYNAERTLDACLHSVFSQDYAHIDVLIIDGGSNPATLSIIRDHSNQLFYWTSEADKGVYDAINKGIAQARGEYIYILGADDQLASRHVVSTMMKAAHNDTDIVYGMVENKEATNRFVPSVHHCKFDRTLYWKNSLHQQGVFYHRSLFHSFRFRIQFKVLADYDFHLHLLYYEVNSVEVNCTVALCKAQGLSKQFARELYKEEWAIKKERLPFFYLIANAIWIPIKFFLKKIGN
ncbi:MAG: glycosyltransferase family 2 protein [Flavobacteriales bacterium]